MRAASPEGKSSKRSAQTEHERGHMTEAADVAEKVRNLLKELPNQHTVSSRISKESDEAKRYARAANQILELYTQHPDQVGSAITVSEETEVPRSEGTIILISPPTAKIAATNKSAVKPAAASRPRKRKAEEETGNSTSSSPPPATTVHFVFGGAGNAIEEPEEPTLCFMIRCRGVSPNTNYSGFSFRRVTRPPTCSPKERQLSEYEQLDAFSLVHAVVDAAGPAGTSSAVPTPSPLLQPPSSLPPREPALPTAHPFACALREANVDAVRALLAGEPRLARAYVAKPPHWTPPNFEVSALTEAISRSEAMPERAGMIVQLLLDRHARVDARDTIGATPLHQAATRGNVQVLRALLDAPGANDALWAQTQGNWLPVHNASNMQREDACRLLIKEMLDNVDGQRSSDRARDNASMMLDTRDWPKPGRCDTTLMDRFLKEEAQNWGEQYLV